MAWTETGDGKLRCDEHGDVFAAGRSCPACSKPGAVAVVAPEVPRGEFERIEVVARAERLPDRVDLRKRLGRRASRSARSAMLYRNLGRRVLGIGADGEPLPGVAEPGVEQHATAQKWFALAEIAEGRGDKLERAHFAVASDCERHARLEYIERLAAGIVERPRPSKRGTA
jgi:hypothetical protein